MSDSEQAALHSYETNPVNGFSVAESASHRRQFELYHQHNASLNTSASNSAGSSPTTTISTADDSSATEMSPSSSPESPMGKPYSSGFAISQARVSESADPNSQFSPPNFEFHRSSMPGRRPRNLKNLAVNTSGAASMGRAASTTSLPIMGALDIATASEERSTSFTKPPSPPKRRPSNLSLTILTPSTTRTSPQNIRLAIPPTPGLSRPSMLRHFQSSPSLPLYTVVDTQTPISSVIQENGELSGLGAPNSPLRTDESEPNFDIPQSKEDKPEAYPNGPICVYGPHLDLYLEPTAEQALAYDVIMNVASEVSNPFNGGSAEVDAGPRLRFDGGGGIQYAPKRNGQGITSATAHSSLSTVREDPPTTPIGTPLRDTFLLADVAESTQLPTPEYIHIPWEHNTDIVPDLLRLVKLIDDRVQHGKRVLIHCQCGVSRSATLVVAYVIYKNPSMSVQEAYDAVKRRSKWIGPNMNLIMQLQEFRSTLIRPTVARFASLNGLSPISPSIPISDWERPGPHAGNSAEIKSPQTAPLPMQNGLASQLTASTDRLALSPGPSSAPSGLTWPSQNTAVSDNPSVTRTMSVPQTTQEETAYVDPAGHVVPVLRLVGEADAPEIPSTKQKKERPQSLHFETHNRQDSGRHIVSRVSPRSAEFAMGPLQPSKDVDSADSYGLLSPRIADFPNSPFARESLLSTVGMSLVASEDNTGVQQGMPQRQALPLPHNKLQHLTAVVNNDNSPAVEALLSPRAFEFTQNPFALPFSQIKSENKSGPLAAPAVGEDDPRSPPQKGNSPIIRHIDDVL